MSAKSKPEPRRTRFTVPAADTSSNKWLDLQDDASVSMRFLIRESIERNGYIDVVNRPVEKTPRRGRPPKTEGNEYSDDEGYESDPTSDEVETGEAEPLEEQAPVALETPPASEPASDPVPEPVAKQAAPEAKPATSAMDSFLT